MSSKERLAWVSLAALLMLFGAYFILLARGIARLQVDGVDFVILFAAVVLLLTGVRSAAWWIERRRSSPHDRAAADERERLFDLRAARIAYAVLIVLILLVAGFVGPAASVLAEFLHGMEPTEVSTFLMSNAVLLAVLAAELVRTGVRIILHRRGY